MISQPIPPPIPVVTLADRIKTWPMLAAHRFEEVEAVLLSLEARLTALEPKQGGKSIFAPAIGTIGVVPPRTPPFVPISPPVPIPGPLAPIPEPSVLPTAESYAQSEAFAGKSIFAPPTQSGAQVGGLYQGGPAPTTQVQTGVVTNPAQPTIFNR
jgi:hypothetical protein